MAVRLGVGNALVGEPGVHLVVIFEPQPRREEAFTDQPDLVLDLPLLPTRCRRAGDRVDEVVAANPPAAGLRRKASPDVSSRSDRQTPEVRTDHSGAA